MLLLGCPLAPPFPCPTSSDHVVDTNGENWHEQASPNGLDVRSFGDKLLNVGIVLQSPLIVYRLSQKSMYSPGLSCPESARLHSRRLLVVKNVQVFLLLSLLTLSRWWQIVESGATV